MAAYLKKEKEQLSSFSAASMEVIPRSKNLNADALAKLALMRDAYLLDAIGSNGIDTRTIMDGSHSHVLEDW